MTDQFAFSYPSPLEGYENLEPLSELVSYESSVISILTIRNISERNDDGKSFKNPQHGVLSKAYEEFPDPLCKDRRGGFDIHIYHYQVENSPSSTCIRYKSN